MARAKLKANDYVLLLKLKDRIGNRRLQHEAFIDRITQVTGNKVKLNKHQGEDFDDDGKHADPKKRIVKLKPFLLARILKGIGGGIAKIDSITSIKFDDAFVKALEKENDSEIR